MTFSPVEPSWDVAREIAATSFTTLPAEMVRISESAGRVLAEDSFAQAPLPFYDTSAMDGWVVNGDQPWRIVGEVSTGYLPRFSLEPGQCARIGTGGIIPDGGTSVIRWEDATESDGFISGQTQAGKDIRLTGAECAAGELLARAGTLLQPATVGNLAGSGIDEVRVVKRPRVALLFLGDELIHDGLPRDGKIRDSLGVQLPALFTLIGSDVVMSRFIDDEYQSLVDAVKSLIGQVDIVVTTGGTADGARDHVHPLLQELKARYLVNRVKARPGHPMLLASLSHNGRDVAFLGLPGNPQSALAAITTLGIPLIATLYGQEINLELPRVPTSEEVVAPADFNRLMAGKLIDGSFFPAQKLGSNMLRGVAAATGFAVLDPGLTQAGGLVRWLAIPLF